MASMQEGVAAVSRKQKREARAAAVLRECVGMALVPATSFVRELTPAELAALARLQFDRKDKNRPKDLGDRVRRLLDHVADRQRLEKELEQIEAEEAQEPTVQEPPVQAPAAAQ